MKKKWELIKEAYDRYPKGTEFKGLGEFEVYVSTGNFDFSGENIFDVETGGLVYCYQRWADIVQVKQKPDLLDGKVAIRVNDEHEFKALMKHYEEKGFITAKERGYLNLLGRSEVWTYEKDSYRPSESEAINEGYHIINFPDFAAQVGIEVPKPLLRSEDNVDLFEGDDVFRLVKFEEGWLLHKKETLNDSINHLIHDRYKNLFKWFSTREAAEAWVAEKNRPKEGSQHGA